MQNTVAAWHKIGVLERKGHRPVAYIATFTVGYLGVQVLGRKIVETSKGGIIFNPGPIEPPAAFDGALQQILPVTGSGVTWPPPLIMRLPDSRVHISDSRDVSRPADSGPPPSAS